MSENLEKQICESCGAEIRANALFCFNCGAQVASDEAVQADIEHEEKVSNAWFKEELAEAPKAPQKATSPQKVKEKVSKKTKDEVKVNTNNNGKGLDKQTETPVKLKSAASIKDRSKLGGRKTVEIEWDLPESAPNVWFLIVSFILLVFAIFILFAMLYIR